MTQQTFGVATKAVVFNDTGEVLLLSKSSSEDINPNTFDIPGGRLKFGEKLEDALSREVSEEVGIRVEIEKVTRTWGFTKGDLHLVGISYKCKYLGGEIKLSDEHTNAVRKTVEEVQSGDFPDRLKKEVEVAL